MDRREEPGSSWFYWMVILLLAFASGFLLVNGLR